MQILVGLNDPTVVFRDGGMKRPDMGHVLSFHGDERFGNSTEMWCINATELHGSQFSSFV